MSRSICVGLLSLLSRLGRVGRMGRITAMNRAPHRGFNVARVTQSSCTFVHRHRRLSAHADAPFHRQSGVSA
ncbi:MAG: hypothetical protein QOC89_4471 [Paraburkholderia sp.]|nr:hypothetical protein [Paraburkholderia sp.]